MIWGRESEGSPAAQDARLFRGGQGRNKGQQTRRGKEESSSPEQDKNFRALNNLEPPRRCEVHRMDYPTTGKARAEHEAEDKEIKGEIKDSTEGKKIP